VFGLWESGCCYGIGITRPFFEEQAQLKVCLLQHACSDSDLLPRLSKTQTLCHQDRPADQWPNRSNDHHPDLRPPVRITWTPWLELRQNSHISAFDILTPSLPIGIPQYAYFHLDSLDRLLASEDTTIPYDLEVGVFIDLLSTGSSSGGGTTRSCHGTIGELGPAAVLKVFPWNDALVVLTYGTNRTSICVCVVPDSQWKSLYKYYIHRNHVPKI